MEKCHTFNHGEKDCAFRTEQSKPKEIWVPKKQSEDATQSTSADMQKVLNSTDVNATDKSGDQWQIVKGKNIGARSKSPSNDRKKPDSIGSPKEISPNDKNVQNQFLSQSNLEGDSNAPVEEIARTTTLVMWRRHP